MVDGFSMKTFLHHELWEKYTTCNMKSLSESKSALSIMSHTDECSYRIHGRFHFSHNEQ